MNNTNFSNFGYQNGNFNGSNFPNQVDMNYRPQPGMMYSATPIMQPQMMPQPRLLYSRYINNEEEILPKEVPNDGTVGTFITKDLKRIYLKTIGSDGLVYTDVFESINKPSENQGTQVDPLSLIMERLEKIETAINELPKDNTGYIKPQKRPNPNFVKNNHNQNKEVKQNE